jgi:four helix bundle protein
MARAERFEDLLCWQAARDLVKLVYLACEKGKLSRDFETRGQLKRAALSAMSNIAEGFGRRYSDKEFIRFLDISQGSAIEVKSVCYVLEDLNYLSPEEIASIRQRADDVTRLNLALIRHLRSKLSERVGH